MAHIWWGPVVFRWYSLPAARVAPSILGLTISGALVSRGVPVCSTEGGLSPTPEQVQRIAERFDQRVDGGSGYRCG